MFTLSSKIDCIDLAFICVWCHEMRFVWDTREYFWKLCMYVSVIRVPVTAT